MFPATVFPVYSESGDIIGHVDDDQLTRLHDEAEAAGDYAAAAWCDLALADDETTDEYGDPLVSPTGRPTTRSEARRVCLAMIDDAAAQRDDDASPYQYRDDDADPRYAWHRAAMIQAALRR